MILRHSNLAWRVSCPSRGKDAGRNLQHQTEGKFQEKRGFKNKVCQIRSFKSKPEKEYPCPFSPTKKKFPFVYLLLKERNKSCAEMIKKLCHPLLCDAQFSFWTVKNDLSLSLNFLDIYTPSSE